MIRWSSHKQQDAHLTSPLPFLRLSSDKGVSETGHLPDALMTGILWTVTDYPEQPGRKSVFVFSCSIKWHVCFQELWWCSCPCVLTARQSSQEFRQRMEILSVKEKYFPCYIMHQWFGALLFSSLSDCIMRFVFQSRHKHWG